MISSIFIPVHGGNILKATQIVILYKPVSGCGILGEDNETNYSLFSMFGFNINSKTEDTIIDEYKLKDFAKLGFPGYIDGPIPPDNATGDETLVIIDTGDLSAYTSLFYEITDAEYLKYIIDINLIFTSKTPIPKGT